MKAAAILRKVVPVLIALGVYALALSLPLPRQIGLTMRYSFYLVVLIVGLGGYAAFRIPGLLGRTMALSFLLAMFALLLTGLWASGQSEQYILGGIFPWSDANNYYFDALRSLEGVKFGTFSASRPLFPAVLATFLNLTGRNFQLSIALTTLVAAFGLYLAARELQSTHGTLAAAVFLTVMFFFVRPYIGSTMSETMGFGLGMAAFALLWRSGGTKTRRTVTAGLAGIFLLTLALQTRNGAFFVLPFVVLWLAWTLRGTRFLSWRYLALGSVMVAAAFLSAKLVSVQVTDPNNNESYHLGMQVYSLVTGGRHWYSLFRDYGNLQALTSNERMQKALSISFDYFRQHPLDTVRGALVYWGSYFTESSRGGFSYLDGASPPVQLAVRIGMFLLAALALGSAVVRHGKDSRLMLLALGALGMFLSIPLVPPPNTFRLRLFAATAWVEGALAALGLVILLNWLLGKRFAWVRRELQTSPVATGAGPYAYGIVLAGLILLGPPLNRLTRQPTAFTASACPAGRQAVVTRVAPYSYLLLVENGDAREGRIPYVRRLFFRDKAHNIANTEIMPEFERLQSPTALLYNLDLTSMKRVMVVAPLEMFPQQNGIVQVCGNYTPNPTSNSDFFFYAESIQQLR